MVNERVSRELRAALDTMRAERDQLNKQISAMETLLGQMGGGAVRRGPGRPPKAAPAPAAAPAKRGPGRPPKSAPAPAPAPAKRGPGRPKGSKNIKRGPGRPKGSGKKAAPVAAPASSGGKRRAPKWSAEAREAARQRMQSYWAERKKKS